MRQVRIMRRSGRDGHYIDQLRHALVPPQNNDLARLDDLRNDVAMEVALKNRAWRRLKADGHCLLSPQSPPLTSKQPPHQPAPSGFFSPVASISDSFARGREASVEKKTNLGSFCYLTASIAIATVHPIDSSTPVQPATGPGDRAEARTPFKPATDERRLGSVLPLFVGRSKDSVPIEHHLGAPGLTSLEKEGAGDGRTVANYPQRYTPWWKQTPGY